MAPTRRVCATPMMVAHSHLGEVCLTNTLTLFQQVQVKSNVFCFVLTIANATWFCQSGVVHYGLFTVALMLHSFLTTYANFVYDVTLHHQMVCFVM